MTLDQHIKNASEQSVRDALHLILARYLTPSFGSLTKRDIDLLIFTALERIGYIEDDPSLYALVQQLRVTRGKARGLLYERELRRMGERDLDEKVRQALRRPLLQKQGELFVLEIDNPLVIDHLRSKLQMLGHATDSSFSPSLVKLSDDAIIDLLENMLDAKHRERARREFVKAGFPDNSFQGVMKDVFKALAKKVADEAGSRIVEQVFGPLMDGAFEKIGKAIADAGLDTVIKKMQKEQASAG